ncbi:DASS family sodium-coupled anion symporter [Hyphomonas sp. FCG-A18]|uniref:SLC13 family permease n=1 Tax=Hyphomonas sp. FCG-A18 TaxID=3080019 RepID=UPI002B294E1F|nr:DASS family sodium-coupled anion symporter [Hyphomonas sp. FCG-A18]
MSDSRSLPKTIGLIAGPVLASVMLLSGVPEGLSFAAWATGALMVWMAIWWATEPIPIPVTSLLPLIVLPLVGAGAPTAVGASYAHHIVLLLLGGFILALGIERWGLHKRIALRVVSMVGASPRALVGGFMLATAVLSMWISNTASTLMMVPIALSAAAALSTRDPKFTIALLLGVCYAASIGGVGTPIGTPTNLIAIDWLQKETGASIGFPQWMAFGLPTVAVLIPAVWWVVTREINPIHDGEAAMQVVHEERAALGKMTVPEVRIAMVFALIAFLWMGRLWWVMLAEALGWDTLAQYSGAQVDMMIAVLGAVLVFLVPAGGGEKRALLAWDEAVKLPWGVLLLFGGGIALGRAVSNTGLSAWIGEALSVMGGWPPILFIAAVVLLVIFLTELTSNVATMTTLAPILGSLSVGVGVAPASLLAPAAVAASCAFMLPVATAPNAIIYATDRVTIEQMMKRGLRINLIAAVVITVIGFWLAPLVL